MGKIIDGADLTRKLLAGRVLGCWLLGLALSGCQGPAPEPDPAIHLSENSARVRAVIFTAFNRDGWETISERTGIIQARSTIQEASPPELLVHYDETHIDVRYGGGMTASAEQNEKQPFVHALPKNAPGHAVVAAYTQSAKDHYAEQVSDRCDDVVDYLRKDKYPFPITVGCDAAAIPLTGTADPALIKAAAIHALRDHDWEISDESARSFIARMRRDDGRDVQVKVVYDSHALICRYSSGVSDFAYLGPDVKPGKANSGIDSFRFGHWMHIFDVDTRVYLATQQFQSPKDVLGDSSEQ